MLKINEFSKLTNAEANALFKAPALVAVLVAAADNKIDEQETEWAKKVIGYRQNIGEETLFEYYEQAEPLFEVTIHEWINNDMGSHERIAAVASDLEDLNEILEKLDPKFAKKLAQSWRTLATQVAKATGGFLGMGSISDQERRIMELDMVEF